MSHSGRYTGTVDEIGWKLVRDTCAAKGRCLRLAQRAMDGEPVMAELERESREAVERAFIIRQYAAHPDFEKFLSLANGDEEMSAMLRARIIRYILAGGPIGSNSAPPRLETAARFISDHAGEPRISPEAILQSPNKAKTAYRRASKRLHPDVGGDTRLMQQLTEAHQTLMARRN